MKRAYQLVVGGILLLSAAQLAPAADQKYEWKDGGWAPMVAPAEGTMEGELAIVQDHLANKRPKKAVKAAKRFLKRWKNDAACEEVMMLAGRAEMERGRYYQAFEWFDRQLVRYPAGRYFQRSLEKECEIAEAFLAGKKRLVGPFRLKATGEAIEILYGIAEHAPGSGLAKKALLRVADHYHARGSWREAIDAYDHFLKLYGKSDQAAYAMLQAARASLSSFKGVRFDDTPLLEAEQRFRTFMQRFGQAARKENVPQILASIEEMKAYRLYDGARFYDRTGRRPAAMVVYKRLVKDYPQTQWAQTARKDLARLGGPTAAEAAEGQTPDKPPPPSDAEEDTVQLSIEREPAK